MGFNLKSFVILILIASGTLAIGCNKVGFKNVDPNAEDFSKPLADGSDSFIQSKDPYKVDILFIDDNSGSMFALQSQISQKFPSFTAALKGIDWQIGITTTDVSNGVFGLKGSLLNMTGGSGQVIKSSDPNGESIFQKSITRTETLNCELGIGPCPSDQSKPIEALVDAIGKRNTLNTAFFRSGAELAVVMLSNADENPIPSPARSQILTANDAVAAFQSAWPTGKRLLSYGIAILPGDSTCLSQQSQNGTLVVAYGTQITALSNLTGGTNYSLCEPDYSKVLSDLGTSIRNINTTFQLSRTPSVVTDTNVVFTPAAPGITWSVVGSKLILSSLPPKGTEIKVFYQYRL